MIFTAADIFHKAKFLQNFGKYKNVVPLRRASPTQPAPGQSPRVGTQQGYPVVAV